MPINVKPMEKIATKWAARAGAAAPEYADGVRNPKRPQMEAAIAGNANWKAGVQTAITNDQFVKGLNRTGPDKYVRKASGTGAARYPQGVRDAQPDFITGFSPFRDALANATLPPRLPKGDPGNNARVQAVDNLMRALKLGK